MSHLIEEYAKSCGVKIGKPAFQASFYPIAFEKYVTIHHGTCPATTYSYWEEMIDLLSAEFKKLDIKIIQILDKEDQKINSVDQHVLCSKKSAAFIIQNSLCHIGVDSIYTYFAGEKGIPLLAIYSHTSPNNTRPWFFNKKKSKFLTSINEDEKPSYDLNENPKTIDTLKPEIIAKSVFEILGIKKRLKFKTLFIGNRYKDYCLDIVPAQPTSVRGERINVRMDITHNEEILKQILKNNTAEVTLSFPISKEILESGKISVINYVAEEFDKGFVLFVKSLGIHLNLLCVSEEKLAKQRFDFFDYDIIFHDLKSIIQNNSKRFNDLSDNKIRTKSNKRILIGDKEFYSYLEAIQSKELFLLDLDWLYIYSVQ